MITHNIQTVQLGSVVLFGLYLVVKFFGVEWINWLLGWYFTVAGAGSVWKVRRTISVESAAALHAIQ